MAIDTRDKRASCLGVGAFFVVALPLADGAVDSGDRMQTAYSYRGIAASAPQSGGVYRGTSGMSGMSGILT